MKTGILLLAAMLMAGTATIQAKGKIKTPKGYELVWADEFDGQQVNTDNWSFVSMRPGMVNHELQRYVPGGELDGNRTAKVQDGCLVITAMKYDGQVISARMNSREAWKYGYIEARIKLPEGKGTWPAFWMMPRDSHRGWPACGEMDIMEEVGYHANYTSSSLHCKSYYHVLGNQINKERYTKKAEGKFHTYAMEWTPDGIFMYVDGVHDDSTLTFLNDGTGNDDTWPFNKEFYIILNVAWGGDWGGKEGVDESALPAAMEVDYVRVFQKKDR